MGTITRTKTEELIVTFRPQAWVGDNAIDVDPMGPTSYPVTEEMSADWPEGWMNFRYDDDRIDVNEFEYIVKDGAPYEWIREYTGPFEFELSWRGRG